MVHVVDVSEFVEDDIIAEWFRDFHEADIKRDSAGGGATAPAGVGVGEAQAGIAVAVLFCPKFEPIRQIFPGLFGENLLLGVAGALSGGIFEWELGTDLLARAIKPAFGKKYRGVFRSRYRESSGSRNGKLGISRPGTFANHHFAKFGVCKNHLINFVFTIG